jgi:2-polyprenyl-3-methyl-5-hydroxy-6-metoxy-1,4-benzoquinol methylase
MDRITWTHPNISRILNAIPANARTLLDVGCGRGIIGALCRIYREMDRQVGIDGYAPSLELCRRHAFYDELLDRRLEALPLPFAAHEFDVATCIEVIEHLPKPAGLALLAELERVAKCVVVSTPNGFLAQSDLDANPLQRHRSGWSVADFERRGYRVRGVGGMKVFGRHRRLLSAALEPATYYAPRLSELLLCVRTA